MNPSDDPAPGMEIALNSREPHFYSQPTQVLDFDPINWPDPASLEVLVRKFGHNQFRPFQWEIISSILNKKQDNCAIMATGHGKSLCFQFPAVFSGGMTLVISPLISLMQDQVLSLTVANIPACLMGSAQSHPASTIEGILNGEYSIVYLTPEFCCGQSGLKLLCEVRDRCNVALVAVDEAHCVSSWGHDFRPQYRRLGILKDIFAEIPLLAVTATATERVVADIMQVLKLRNPQFICSGFDRPNLYFEVRRTGYSVFEDLRSLMIYKDGQLMFPGPTIIYCIRRRDTVEISDLLNRCNVKSLPYHAGMCLVLRKLAHEQFVNDKISVIVATIAFGMGIDKPDVRNIIHYGTSGSLEAYYQEVGRAGRDGCPSKCITFFSDLDFEFHEYLFWKSGGDKTRRKQLLVHMKQYLRLTTCRREFILKYFDNKDPKLEFRGDCCDNCQRISINRDIATAKRSNVQTEIDTTYYTILRLLINERSRLAALNKCMPYMVASDNILTEMAKHRPRTIHRLRKLKIDGLTEARIDKFMPQLLSVIKNNTPEEFYVETEDDVLIIEEVIEEIKVEDGQCHQDNIKIEQVDDDDTYTDAILMNIEIKEEEIKIEIPDVSGVNNNIENADEDAILMNFVIKEDNEIEDDGYDDILVSLCDQIDRDLDNNNEPPIKKLKSAANINKVPQ